MTPVPKTKRMFGRKPQKNLRRLEAFIARGKDLGHLGDKSALEQELNLRKQFLNLGQKERAEKTAWEKLRIGGVEEGTVKYGTGDQALRVHRSLMKMHFKRNPNALIERYTSELEELRGENTVKPLNMQDQLRLRELIKKIGLEEERLKRENKKNTMTQANQKK